MHLHEIFDIELKRFGDKPLNIIETGTIRGRSESSEIADGYSTLYFARRVKRCGGRFRSIDLNTKTANLVLKDRGGLDLYADLCEGHSISWLAIELALMGRVFDVVFLDSDNDPQLVFHEFLIAEQLIAPDGLILIDDVRMEHHADGESALAKKGDLVWPHVRRNGYTWRIHERAGWASYKTGVLAIDPKAT